MQRRKVERLWIDIETTGLDPEFDVPLELGLAVTDRWGMPCGDNWKFSAIVNDRTEAFEAAVKRGRDNDIVGQMHKDSGLWVSLMGGASILEVEKSAKVWLEGWSVPLHDLRMAGSSVGQLDRPFTIAYFPGVADYFHPYRVIDVSSIKECCRDLNPRVYDGLEQGAQKRELHRVIPDMEDTILEYRFYVENFLWTDD